MTRVPPFPTCAREQVVAIPDANLDKASCASAHEVLDSLQQFAPEAWGLAPYVSAAVQPAP